MTEKKSEIRQKFEDSWKALLGAQRTLEAAQNQTGPFQLAYLASKIAAVFAESAAVLQLIADAIESKSEQNVPSEEDIQKMSILLMMLKIQFDQCLPNLPKVLE